MVIQSSEGAGAHRLDWGPQVKTPTVKLPTGIPGEEQKGGQMPENIPGLPDQGSNWSGGALRTMDFDQTFAMDASNSTGKASLKQKSEAMAIANQFIQALKSLQPPIEPSLLDPIVDKLGKIVAKLGEQIRAIEAGDKKPPGSQSKDGATQPAASEASQSPAQTPAQTPIQKAPEGGAKAEEPGQAKPQQAPKSETGTKPLEGGSGDGPEANPNQGTGHTEGKASSETAKPEKQADNSSDKLLKMLQDKRISASIRGMLDQQAYQQLVSWLKSHSAS